MRTFLGLLVAVAFAAAAAAATINFSTLHPNPGETTKILDEKMTESLARLADALSGYGTNRLRLSLAGSITVGDIVITNLTVLGNLITINGISYYFPTTVGGTNNILVNVGGGTNNNLAWFNFNTNQFLVGQDTNVSIKTGALTTNLVSQDSLTVPGDGATPGTIVWKATNGTDSVTLKAPNAVTSYVLTLPSAQGAANEVMKNNGSGVLSWGSAGAPAVWTNDASHIYPVDFPSGSTSMNFDFSTANFLTATFGDSSEYADIATGPGLLRFTLYDNSLANPVLVLHDPWVTSGTGYPAHLVNTATYLSDPSDVLLALQNFGTNKFQVRYDGAIVFPDGTAQNTAIWTNDTDLGTIHLVDWNGIVQLQKTNQSSTSYRPFYVTLLGEDDGATNGFSNALRADNQMLVHIVAGESLLNDYGGASAIYGKASGPDSSFLSGEHAGVFGLAASGLDFALGYGVAGYAMPQTGFGIGVAGSALAPTTGKQIGLYGEVIAAAEEGTSPANLPSAALVLDNRTTSLPLIVGRTNNATTVFQVAYNGALTVNNDDYVLSDVTTANSSTSAHGFLKKLSGSATDFMNGAGNWATPAGSGPTGSGTANTIVKWATSTTLGDSLITESGTKETVSGDLLVNQGDVTTDRKGIELDANWNSSGVAFTGLKINITNTAANASSKMLDIQKGGVSRYYISRDEQLRLPSHALGGPNFAPSIVSIDDPGYGIFWPDANSIGFGNGTVATEFVRLDTSGVSIATGYLQGGAHGAATAYLSGNGHTWQVGQLAGSAPQQIIGGQQSGVNLAGTSLTVSGGISTGSGRGGALILGTTLSNAGASNSTNAIAPRTYYSAKEVTLTESTATLVFNITLASTNIIGIRVMATTHADDATDFQSVTETFCIAAVNKAGAVTTTVSTSSPTATLTSSGTLATTWTAVANGNSIDVKCSAVSSLTQNGIKCLWRADIDAPTQAVVVTAQ